MTLTSAPRLATGADEAVATVEVESRLTLVKTHLGLLAAFGVVVLLRSLPLASVLAAGYLLLVPGDLLRTAFRVPVRSIADRMILAVSGSLVILLAVVGLTHLVLALSPGGLTTGALPLRTGPLLVGVVAVVLALLLRSRQLPDAAPLPSPAQLLAGAGTGAALLVAFLGAKLVDGDRPALALVLAGLLVLGVAGVALIARGDRSWLLPWALFTLAAVVGWSFTQRTSHLFGFDVHQELLWAERTWSAGYWSPWPGDGYGGMLSITALPAALSELTGLSLLDLFKGLGPLLFAVYVVAVYSFLRRWAGRWSSVLCVVLLLGNPVVLWQLPFIFRQEIAFIPAAAALLLLFGTDHRPRGKVALAALFGASIAFCHYSTSYVFVAILLLAYLLSLVARRFVPAEIAGTRLPGVVVLVAGLTTLFWNGGVNNVMGRAGDAVVVGATTQAQLHPGSNPLTTWLSGTSQPQVPPDVYFDATAAVAHSRAWLIPYPTGGQARMAAEAIAVNAPTHSVPLPGLYSPFLVSLVTLRQLLLVAIIVGIAICGWVLIRQARGHMPTERAADFARVPVDLYCLALAALAVTALMRASAVLAQAYNAERLLAQTGMILAVFAALTLDALWRALNGRLGSMGTRLARAAVVVLLVLGLADATGVAAATVGGDAGNVMAKGEYSRRYTVQPADSAAANWLGSRYRDGDMVFADNYGNLLLTEYSNIDRGRFDDITPAGIDQRAYIFATTENLLGGRARGVEGAVRSLFRFPGSFLEQNKGVMYSNGSAEVFK